MASPPKVGGIDRPAGGPETREEIEVYLRERRAELGIPETDADAEAALADYHAELRRDRLLARLRASGRGDVWERFLALPEPGERPN
jgi:hypothetical protein